MSLYHLKIFIIVYAFNFLTDQNQHLPHNETHFGISVDAAM